MSRANESANRITLADDRLAGFNGRVDIVTFRRRPWWRRLLRLGAVIQRRPVFVDVKGTSARAWPMVAPGTPGVGTTPPESDLNLPAPDGTAA